MLAKYVRKYHSKNQIIGDKDVGLIKRRKEREEVFLLSHIEPKDVGEDIKDEG